MYITYCSKKKNPAAGFIPAIQRYNSKRIADLYNKSLEHDVPFAILSGKYGLVKPEQPIPLYDHLMTEDDITRIKYRIIKFILSNNVSSIVYFTKDTDAVKPYHTALSEAVSELHQITTFRVEYIA